MKAKKLPQQVFVHWHEYEGDNALSLVVEETARECVSEVGDKVVVGVYELVRLVTVEAMVGIKPQ